MSEKELKRSHEKFCVRRRREKPTTTGQKNEAAISSIALFVIANLDSASAVGESTLRSTVCVLNVDSAICRSAAAPQTSLPPAAPARLSAAASPIHCSRPTAANSCHNYARVQVESFQDQRHSVSNILRAHGRDIEVSYRTRLTTMLDVTRFLLKQGLSFRGHDESSNSLNRGNFLELLQWYSQRNEEVSKVVNQNAPGNNQMISLTIQKDLTRDCASEITLSIIEDIGNNVFSLMVDESRDISVKEQMRVVLRYVNKRGQVIERFLAIVHVSDTSSCSLKDAIDALFAKHGLSLSRLRGQGYDGASNMRGEFNGLKSLILQENPYASYIHCFSHQLQLVIIAVAKSNLNAMTEMKDNCMIDGRSRRRRQVITNLHYYRVEIFYQVVDSVIQEMNTRFSEVGTELLSCIACLHPRNSFSEFNVQKLVRLCDLYPEDFSTNDCIVIEQQLQNFIHNIRQDPNFFGIEDLGSFAQKIVETQKNQAYPLVYRLIEMALVLPVATASVERVFSAMKMIKTDLRNRMGDEWMNDSLVVYIEKDIFSTIENEQILQRFQKMKSRRMQLPPLSYPTTT
ncbi:uncharacterized protein LOC122042493 [Zingiber officinale]|uniref:uncharacterized protein LOC122042493 n=1 Tax=Zingiber officinale TaxID=94328 RepID=UPI001C4D38C2|nr:uncharacterized protein LOC122042493 [Zingiber officinale]